MKKQMLTTLIVLALAAPTMAMDHSKMGDMDHGKMAAQDTPATGARHGEKIHQSTVDGHTLVYHLIDNAAEMAKAGDMKGHDMSQMKSHHLMVYIQGPAGKEITDAKVGYMVTHPGGELAKTMAPAMDGAYGADVDLKAKGGYEIKLKAVAGETQLLDKFGYEVR